MMRADILTLHLNSLVKLQVSTINVILAVGFLYSVYQVKNFLFS